MKLETELKKLPPETVVKVGASEGNSYFYCGTVSDIIENMASYSDMLYDHAVRSVKYNQKALDSLLSNFPTPKSFYEEEQKKYTQDLTLEGYNARLERWFNQVKFQKKALENAKTRLENFRELPSRTVVESSAVDKAADHVAQRRILVSGSEPGRFWAAEECEKLPCIGLAHFWGGKDDEKE